MRHTTLAFWFMVSVSAAACGGGGGGGDDDDDDSPDAGVAEATYTWHRDVAPVVAANCWGCHSAGGVAPVAFETYLGAKEASSLMAEKTASREMPPWSAGEDDDCAPRFGFIGDLRLSDAEIEMFQVWYEEGSPEGDPDTATPLPDPPEPKVLTGATHVLQPSTSFTTSGDADQFVCNVLDPQLATARWLTGLEVVPGNPQAVHHVVITVVPPDKAAEADALGGPDAQFECFSGPQIEGLYPLGVWVPGSDPMELPAGVGVPILAGSRLIVQMHYHPAGNVYTDRTTQRLRLTATPPGQNYTIFAVGNAFQAPELLDGPNDRSGPEFRIPANMAGHTEDMVFNIDLGGNPQRFPILTTFPHQHYIGVKLSAKIERANPGPDEPAEECLLYTPRWNFDWQRTYTYDTDLDELPTLGDGDTVRIHCEFDNTLANPFVERALFEQDLDEPIDVYLGEESLDEMCLAGFGVLF